MVLRALWLFLAVSVEVTPLWWPPDTTRPLESTLHFLAACWSGMSSMAMQLKSTLRTAACVPDGRVPRRRRMQRAASEG